MGIGLDPQGAGMFGVFLKAQESSPSLILRNARLGDHGAAEVARFIATSTCLRRLDLTGNGITSIGAGFLAQALRQNCSLESLVLRHNEIGEGGEAGLRKLCDAVRESPSLRHLDLGRNLGVAGAPAAVCLGDMLKGNTCLTHLELNWNPLDPAGGQVLLDHLQQNTTLFDCQLSGCGIAPETLLGLAQVLRRNRAVKGADLQAGPYQVSVLEAPHVPIAPAHFLGAQQPTSLARSLDAGATSELQALASSAALSLGGAAGRDGARTSAARTRELRDRLLDLRRSRLYEGAAAGAGSAEAACEMVELIDRAAAQLDEESGALHEVRNHMQLVQEGHEDRCVRYQTEIHEKQDLLLDFERERKDIVGIQTRLADELKLQREAAEQVAETFAMLRRHTDEDEARSKTDLVQVLSDQKVCEARLRELEEEAEQREVENARLRARVEQLRLEMDTA